ncbi:MAG TPA: class I SAM-dependent methyltransferase [Alphaproteobacteria bacterium]
MAIRVEFEKSELAPGRGRCPVCGGAQSVRVLEVDVSPDPPGKLRLNRCASCRSLFYEGESTVIGYSSNEAENAFWKHYVQIGAGIDFMIRPLNAIPVPAGASMLEVGCGFGYAVDYWSRMRGGRAVGLEVAGYGKIGRQLLGVEMYHEYLATCAAIKGDKFDIILSSEVIEHVRNPSAFVAELKSALKPDGVLILTTPSADFISPAREAAGGQERIMVLSALSPGLHYFLVSKTALEKLLKDAGFPHMHVIERNERLLAWASGRAIPRPNLDAMPLSHYLEYLRTLATNADLHVRGGALYRLFKELVNAGNLEEASAVLDELEAVAAEAYGLSVVEPSLGPALATKTFEEHNARFPAWFGCALYYAGIVAANLRGDLRAKLRLFEAAARILRHEIAIAPLAAGEATSLLPLADFHFRQSLVHNLRHEIPYGLGVVAATDTSPLPETLRYRVENEIASLMADLRALPMTAMAIRSFMSLAVHAGKRLLRSWRHAT